ncbi:WD40 repeat domain-containing protein [Nocardioides panzhihuensis]|uniref:WD40 repeat protein n=1 Tax=Nocardioides panzhihuensis TaxID=860243 RepID=A0A7Z0DNG1_9ACTN|nr:PD40 domain-containing protein [Nocardioides panzhihuensis]NYI78728.1 WD40 repeat protein [Nocardioides panzhihuensis]
MKPVLPLSGILLAALLTGCSASEGASCSSSAMFRPAAVAPGAVFPDSLSVSPGGDAVAAGCWQGLCRWDTADGTYEVAFEGNPIALATDWSLVATGGGCGDIALVDLDSGKRVRTLTGLPYEDDVTDMSWIQDAAISPDGKLVAGTGTDDTLMVWTIDGEEVVDAKVEGAGALAFSPDGAQLAVTSDAGVEILDTDNGESTGQVTGAEGLPAWSPNGRWLAGPGTGGAPTVWSVEDLEVVETLPTTDATGFSFSGSSVGFAADNAAAVWSPKALGGDGEPRTLAGLVDSGRTVEGPVMTAFGPDGATLYAATGDTGITAWDLSGDEPGTRFTLPPTSS